MLYRVYIVEPPTLLDDLLEDSARLFHTRCSVIQRIFHEQWLKTLWEKVGEEQIDHPDDAAAEVEVRVRQRMHGCRLALREKQRELIREEEVTRAARDAAIRAYVASLPAPQDVPAAA